MKRILIFTELCHAMVCAHPACPHHFLIIYICRLVQPNEIQGLISNNQCYVTTHEHQLDEMNP